MCGQYGHLVDDVKGRRPYRSRVRAASARATREAVLAAAAELFVERGFALTSIEHVAERAGVSRQTVFTSVGGKTKLLAELRDRALAGDDEAVPVRERPWFLALLADPDPADVLKRYADGVADIARRYAQLEEVLHQAAGADQGLRELWEVNEQQRHFGATSVVEDLLTKGADLRHDRVASTDLLWLLTSSQHYQRLVHARGWSHERYRQWLATTLGHQLLHVPTKHADPGQSRRE